MDIESEPQPSRRACRNAKVVLKEKALGNLTKWDVVDSESEVQDVEFHGTEKEEEELLKVDEDTIVITESEQEESPDEGSGDAD
jgi:hypothetical protein